MHSIHRDNSIFLNRFVDEYISEFGLETFLHIFLLLQQDLEKNLFIIRKKPGAFKCAVHEQLGFEKFEQLINDRCGKQGVKLLHEISCCFVPNNILPHRQILLGLVVEKINTMNIRSPKSVVKSFGEAFSLLYTLEEDASIFLNNIYNMDK